MAAIDHIPDFDDFERYYSGEMSPAEQRSLEGRMLDEPLVAEAYEGFLAWRAQHAHVHPAQVRADLHKRLHTRVAPEKKGVLPLWVYASAASVLLALLAYWAVFLRDQKAGMQKPVMAVKQKDAAPSAPAEVPVPATIQPADAYERPAAVPAPQTPVREPKSSEVPDIRLADAFDSGAVTENSVNLSVPDSIPVEKEVAALPPQPARALAAPGSVQAVGESVAARAKMQPSSRYVVSKDVVNMGTRKESLRAVPLDTLAPVPANGWASYQTYLDQHTDSASVNGQVVVTFVVGPSGGLSDVTAKGPEELQMQAVRIIADGPAWAPARAKGIPVAAPVEIHLQFRKSE